MKGNKSNLLKSPGSIDSNDESLIIDKLLLFTENLTSKYKSIIKKHADLSGVDLNNTQKLYFNF